MQRQYSGLLEDLNLRKGLVEVLNSAAKSVAGEATKQLLKDMTITAFQNVAEETVKALAVAIVGPLLQLLFKVSDRVSAKMDKLISASFETGVREAKRALRLPANNAEEVRYREGRLKFAFDKLEKEEALPARLISLSLYLCSSWINPPQTILEIFPNNDSGIRNKGKQKAPEFSGA